MTRHVVRVADLDSVDPRTAYGWWALRESVFVVEQQCVYAELDGRDLEPGTRHLWVDGDTGPVGYLRVLDEGDEVRIGRVVVAPGHRGQGLAANLMSSALDLAGARPTVLAAQSHLAGWYAALGFERCGADFVEDGIPHTPMRRPGRTR